jgi:hypothetical protein
MTMTIDLIAAYEAGARALYEGGARGDEEFAHIGGDVAGMCDRATWARRTYHAGALVYDAATDKWVNPHEDLRPALPDAQSITAMELGHAAEALILDGLEAGLPEGWKMSRNVGAALIVRDDGSLDGVLTAADHQDELNQLAEDTPRAVIGHIDAIITSPDGSRHVIDVKSTVWKDSFKGGNGREWSPWGPPKESHALQVAAYALAASLFASGNVSAALLELDLGGKAMRLSPVDWQALAPTVRERVIKVIHTTHPSQPEPPAEPEAHTIGKDGTSWACGSITNGRVRKGYCSHTACPRHVLNVAAEDTL